MALDRGRERCDDALGMGREPLRAIDVLIVDDHRTFGQAMALAFGLQPDLEARSVSSADEAEAAIRARRPDVAVIDALMPGTDGIELTRSIVAADPRTRVVVLSEYQDDLLKTRAIGAGASGYLSKNEPLEQVMETIRRCFAGEPVMEAAELERLLRRGHRRRWEHATERQRADRLSPRESEILQLMADGSDPTEISVRLSITPNTLRTHVQNILTKLAVHSKTQAVMVAVRQGKVSTRA